LSLRDTPPLPGLTGDFVTLAALALALALLITFLTALAPTQFGIGVDRYPRR